MLVALLALWLLGSSAGVSEMIAALDGAKTSINKNIEDKDRRTKLLAIVAEAETAAKGHLKTNRKMVDELASLRERYGATSADIRPVLEKFRADGENYQNQMIQKRFALKAEMTREEWTKAFPAGKKAGS